MIKYIVQLGVREGKDWHPVEIIDTDELSLRLGERPVMQVIVPTQQGHKRLTLIAKVEKYP